MQREKIKFEDILADKYSAAAVRWWARSYDGTSTKPDANGKPCIVMTPDAVLAGRNATLFEELAADIRALTKGRK